MHRHMLFTSCTSRCPQTSSWIQSLGYQTMEPHSWLQPSHSPSSIRLPPEDFFNEPITQAADIWTLAVNIYEVLGERALFETFGWDRDDIIAEMVSTLGMLPARWWDAWENRKDFFEPDGSWARDMRRIRTPVFRPLNQRMWVWDVARRLSHASGMWKGVRCGFWRSC